MRGDAYTTNNYTPKPASKSEAGLFYSQRSEKDELLGTIGHLRMDFGRNGKEFWTTWFDHCSDKYNTKEFKAEIDDVVNELRLSVLKDRSSMRSFCSAHGGEIASSYGMRQFGYILETDHYKYCLRCKPMEGDYDGYLYCYDKRVQEMWESRYPYLSDTADFDLLIAAGKETDLQLAERLVSDYYNGKYEVEIPRCAQANENGYHQIDFSQPFALIAHDNRYLADPHAEELAVTTFKWLEGFEDTGYFMELVSSYADELSEMREEKPAQEMRM